MHNAQVCHVPYESVDRLGVAIEVHSICSIEQSSANILEYSVRQPVMQESMIIFIDA